MVFMRQGLYIIYKNNIKYNNLHFDSKASLLKVITWIEYEENDSRYAPMVLEEAYFSNKNEWNHTNYGPYIIEPDIYHSVLAEENLLLFSVNTDEGKQEIFEIANEIMRSAGWGNALLIPKHFYSMGVNY